MRIRISLRCFAGFILAHFAHQRNATVLRFSIFCANFCVCKIVNAGLLAKRPKSGKI